MHILQRCPTYTADIFDELQSDPDRLLLLTHDDGVQRLPKWLAPRSSGE